MKLNIDDFRHAFDTIGDSGGQEAAVVAQFALDLAVTVQFQSDGNRDGTRRSAAASSPAHRAPPSGATGFERHDSLIGDAGLWLTIGIAPDDAATTFPAGTATAG